MEIKTEHVQPVLFLTVIIDPPPIPILWGLTTDVHRRAAMAPSTAEPPCWSMFLEKTFTGFIGNVWTQSLALSMHGLTHRHTFLLYHCHLLCSEFHSVCCQEASLNQELMLEAEFRQKLRFKWDFYNLPHKAVWQTLQILEKVLSWEASLKALNESFH